MLDDDDTKIRRNLVVASGAVVVLTFLQVSFGDLAEFACRCQIHLHTAEWRIWTALLVVLFYLALRLRFSDSAQALAEALHAEYATRLPEGAKKMALAALRKFEVRGASTKSLGFDLQPLLAAHLARVEEAESALPKDGGGVSLRYGSPTFHAKFLELAPFAGRMEVRAISHLPPPNISEESSTSLEQFSMDRTSRAMNRAKAFFFSYVYSKQATTLLIPALLAASAAGITVYRITTIISQH
jgi:hypothetical protein